MTVGEFEAWRQFYLLHPFDSRSLHHRPAALIAASNLKDGMGKLDDLLEWLDPAERTAALAEGWSEADLNTFKALGVKPPPRQQEG